MSNILSGISDAELREELKRRESLKPTAPTPLAEPDFAPLVTLVQDGVSQSIADEFEDDHFQHYVYEEALTCIYGKEYWVWKRQQKW